MINTLEEAMIRIDELEKENEELKAEIERLKARNLGGRKKHDEAWRTSYQEFASDGSVCGDSGGIALGVVPRVSALYEGA
mgnify:CR=1 FL=1